MGCAASIIDKKERVQLCKERKRLMKQLVGFRREFADSQLMYLRSLKNVGVTLRQFTESELLELETSSYRPALLPHSPPPALPPPPPPPPFSPESTKLEKNQNNGVDEEERTEIDGHNDNGCTIPAPPIACSTWDIWDPFESLSPPFQSSNNTNGLEQAELKDKDVEGQVENESWAEAKTEFADENKEQEESGLSDPKLQSAEVIEDKPLMSSCHDEHEENLAMVRIRSKRTLDGIIRELDDYFLKASACEKEIAVFMDICSQGSSISQNFMETKRNRSSSVRVFSVLSWSRSAKSARDAPEIISTEPCRPGAHCSTLEKLYAAEKKLYDELKNEEMTKMERDRKTALLQKQDEEHYERSKIEKTRLSVENLEKEISSLQVCINLTCSSIQKLIDEELYPQLVTLTSGLGRMWRTMYKCHRVQFHISQQLKHLTDFPKMDLSSEYRLQAATQLETEADSWCISFCKLMKSQQEYAKTLCKWIQLTKCLVSDQQQDGCSTAARRLCDNWQQIFEKLPEKAASEAIRNFLTSVRSIMHQQMEERNLRRKSEKLEKRMQKDLHTLAELEMRLQGDIAAEAAISSLGSKHPLAVKRAKSEALNKRVESEKAKYLDSVQISKSLTLNNLKTSLPIVFQDLAVFSGAFAQAFDTVRSHDTPDTSRDAPHTSCDAPDTKDESEQGCDSSESQGNALHV